MGRRLRPWWLALGVSLLLHGSLLGGLAWRLPQWAPPPAEPEAIDVQLASAPAAPAVAVSPPPRTPRSHKPAAQRSAAHRPLSHPVASPPEPRVEPAAEAATLEAPADSAVADTAATGQTGPDAAPAKPESAAAPVHLNDLPARLDLRFQVRYGLASGEQTLVWVNEGGHYTLTSVVGATGLTGLFYRGRFVQTSRGRITPRGLQPETFWDQRGDKRSSARFDVAQGQLTLMSEQGAPRHFTYQGEVQDALSLFFQLALTAPPNGQQTYTVFNGKKLRNYTYEVRGEETLETVLGALRTLHVARVADNDGRFEAWLAIDRHYLPVRVVRSDDKGNEMELRLQSIAP